MGIADTSAIFHPTNSKGKRTRGSMLSITEFYNQNNEPVGLFDLSYHDSAFESYSDQVGIKSAVNSGKKPVNRV